MSKYLYCASLVLCAYVAMTAQTVSDFSLEDIDGELVSYEELKGEQLTVIDFWATWCKPCTKAMPKLNKIYEEYQVDGLNMIGISCDGPRSIAKVKPVAKSLGVDYAILKDIDCEVMNSFQFQAFPTLIIVDQDDEIVWVHEGFSSGDEELIAEHIRELLK